MLRTRALPAFVGRSCWVPVPKPFETSPPRIRERNFFWLPGAVVERAFAADAAGGLLAVIGPGWSGASSGAHLPRWVREKLLEAEASPQPFERGSQPGMRKRPGCAPHTHRACLALCILIDSAPSDISEHSSVTGADPRPRASFTSIPLYLELQLLG